MKIRNDKFTSPIAALIASRKPAVRAFLDANPTLETIDFDDIRASFPPAQRAAMTDGMIHAICIDLGIKVES